MKKMTAIAAILLASLAAVGTASAQDHATKASVPFGFYVGNSWVPAGSYTLTASSLSPNAIAIRNNKTSVSMINLGHQTEKQAGPNVLVFKKYGDQYFLHEIRCASGNMNVGFSTSKREKQAQTNEASLAPATDIYLAMN
jgi:hypothetical protein